jgi:hypothetical protein
VKGAIHAHHLLDVVEAAVTAGAAATGTILYLIVICLYCLGFFAGVNNDGFLMLFANATKINL